MANQILILNSGQQNDMYRSTAGVGSFTGISGLGYEDLGGGDNREVKCAFRFPAVNLPRGGCDHASLYFYTQHNGVGEGMTRGGGWNFSIFGIAEDNAGDFGGGDPFGRTKTSGSSTSTNSDEPNTGTYKEIDVTTPVNEIMARSGWNQNNAVALLLEPTATAQNKYATTFDSSHRLTFLTVRKNAQGNFKPDPVVISAPSFPAADDFGMRISYPGYDVMTATETQLYFTTRKRCPKVVLQGVINTTGGVPYTIAHGLGYAPFARAFFKSVSSSKRFRIPRFLPNGQQDPDADTTNGLIEVDNTNVTIQTDDSCEVYYYIFIDQLG